MYPSIRMSKRVLSFSLWGDNLIYLKGILRNVDAAKDFYPDFECWVYVAIDTVPSSIVHELNKRENVRVISRASDKKMCMWRFESIDDPDVAINLSRDCDTKMLLRERFAVEQWLQSDKTFHVMRDHPNHTWVVMAGMFGTRKCSGISSWTNMIEQFETDGEYTCDQQFLQTHIYPRIRHSTMVHSTCLLFEGETPTQFPVEYDKQYNFVGQRIFADGQQVLDDVNILKTTLSVMNRMRQTASNR